MDKKLVVRSQDQIGAQRIRSEISAILRGVRRKIKMRQYELAEALGVTVGTANKLERGQAKWTDETIFRVAEIVGADLPAVFRALADALEGAEATVDPTPSDPLRAKLNDLYERRDWTGLMRHLGDLADAWGDDLS
jgi:transcriptional regulator with XRE-family HTH domain